MSLADPSIFQSDGLCTETCANYAFAVLKGEGCWCSNVAPSNLVSNSECNSSCPGYPADLCGNDSKGLYGYYAIAGNSPTSTASGDGASITSTPTSSGSVSHLSPFSDLELGCQSPRSPVFHHVLSSLSSCEASKYSLFTLVAGVILLNSLTGMPSMHQGRNT